MTVNFSPQCLEVLRALSERRNVLISGPPASGKSRLLAEVALAFEANSSAPTIDLELQKVLPSAARSDRRVFRTVFTKTPSTGNS